MLNHSYVMPGGDVDGYSFELVRPRPVRSKFYESFLLIRSVSAVADCAEPGRDTRSSFERQNYQRSGRSQYQTAADESPPSSIAVLIRLIAQSNGSRSNGGTVPDRKSGEILPGSISNPMSSPSCRNARRQRAEVSTSHGHFRCSRRSVGPEKRFSLKRDILAGGGACASDDLQETEVLS